MEWENQAQAACYERVEEYLREAFADRLWASSQSPFFVLRQGSATATVDVQAWNDASVVRAWSLVVTDLQPTPELYAYLLQLNAGQRFGAFALDKDNDIVLSHALIGDHLDAEELRHSVEAVVQAADLYDDAILERFGGRRALDRESHGDTAA